METARMPSEDCKEIAEGMSNFDHSIDDGFEEKLRAAPGKVFGHHAAWDFNGRVWFGEDGKFHEQVWVYGSPVAEHEAETLRELMEVVNDEHGRD